MNVNLLTKKYNSEASLKLLMYTTMPATDSAWQSGFESSRLDISIDDNPYNVKDNEFQFWENGWWAGFYEDDYIAEDIVNKLGYYQQCHYKPNDHNVDAQVTTNNDNPVDSNEKSKLLTNLGLKKLLLTSSLLLVSIVGVGILLME